MLKDNLPKNVSVNWLLTSFQGMKHSDFKYLFVFFFSTKTNDWCTQFVEATGFFPSHQQVNDKRAPDLGWFVRTHFLARFVLFHFSNFVYVRARMCLSTEIQPKRYGTEE
mgnify:CR=1 FL=1